MARCFSDGLAGEENSSSSSSSLLQDNNNDEDEGDGDSPFGSGRYAGTRVSTRASFTGLSGGRVTNNHNNNNNSSNNNNTTNLRKRGPAPYGPSNYLPVSLAVPLSFVMPSLALEWPEPFPGNDDPHWFIPIYNISLYIIYSYMYNVMQYPSPHTLSCRSQIYFEHTL